MLERLTTRLFVICPIVVVLGGVALWLAEAGSGEYWVAVKWYAGMQAKENLLLWPTCGVAALALFAWGFVATREERSFSRDLGGVGPLRHLGVVEDEGLVRKARGMILPELSRSKPRIERAMDVLFGAMVDLGASGLRLNPAKDQSEVVLVVGMDKFPVGRMSAGLHAELVRHLALMLALDKMEGSGSIKLRSGEAVEQIDVELRAQDEGVQVRLQVASRARPALTLARLGMPEAVLDALRRGLQQERGLIVICAPPRHGASTTLYASAHFVHHDLGLRPGRIAALEPHVDLVVPFMHQAEHAGRPPAAVLKTLVRGQFKVLLLRTVADAETARLAAQAAGDRLVIIAVEAEDLGAGLARLAAWAGADLVAEKLSLAIGERLLPRLCSDCRKQGGLTEQQDNDLAAIEIRSELYHPVGCEACLGRGQRGKQPLFWMLGRTAWLQDALKRGVDADGLRAVARRGGGRGPLEEALELALRGDISADTLAKLAQREIC